MLTFRSFGSSILAVRNVVSVQVLTRIKTKNDSKTFRNFTTRRWIYRMFFSFFLELLIYSKINTFSRKRVNCTKQRIISLFQLTSRRPCRWKKEKNPKLFVSNSANFLYIFIYPHGRLVNNKHSILAPVHVDHMTKWLCRCQQRFSLICFHWRLSALLPTLWTFLVYLSCFGVKQ